LWTSSLPIVFISNILSSMINPYPGKWVVKWPTVHFCLCISETVRHTAMRFWDIVQDSEGYLQPYKVLSHFYWKCGHDGVKLEVHVRKSAKVVCPIVNLMITSNKHFINYFHIFMVTWTESAVGLVSWCQYVICDPEIMCLVFGNLQIYFLCEVISTSGFEHDRDAILVIWRRHVPHDVVSHFIEFMDT